MRKGWTNTIPRLEKAQFLICSLHAVSITLLFDWQQLSQSITFPGKERALFLPGICPWNTLVLCKSLRPIVFDNNQNITCDLYLLLRDKWVCRNVIKLDNTVLMADCRDLCLKMTILTQEGSWGLVCYFRTKHLQEQPYKPSGGSRAGPPPPPHLGWKKITERRKAIRASKQVWISHWSQYNIADSMSLLDKNNSHRVNSLLGACKFALRCHSLRIDIFMSANILQFNSKNKETASFPNLKSLCIYLFLYRTLSF